MSPVVVTRSSSDGNAMRFVFPVLWIKSCIHIMREYARIKNYVYVFVQFARWRQQSDVRQR